MRPDQPDRMTGMEPAFSAWKTIDQIGLLVEGALPRTPPFEDWSVLGRGMEQR